ncbi:MAG: hypothetical protein HYW05_02545 [Candidatus Diapherotrites archaeon]|nr:hypothetical protein [Candidatus Diapherotrites archaeon]
MCAEKILLVKTASEISLKSEHVMRFFMRKLAENIKTALKNSGAECGRIVMGRGRLFISADATNLQKIPQLLPRIFGLHAFAPAEIYEGAEMENIKSAVVEYAKPLLNNSSSFALRVSRSGQHKFSSHDVAVQCGAAIQAALPNLKVDLKNPEKEIFIEIINKKFYLYDAEQACAGGLPLGVEGAVAALFSGNENDALAAWLVMKRGCRVFPIAEKESAKIKGAVNSLIPWNSLREFRISRENELKGLIAEHNLRAVVSADENPKEASIAELPILYPLAFFPEQMKKELEKRVGA